MPGELIQTIGLDFMSPGEADLSVPSLGDILQVNAAKKDAMKILHVEKTQDSLMIIREDRMPLQVHVRFNPIVRKQLDISKTDALLFTMPTPVVELTRHPSLPNGWLMSPEMPSCDTDAAGQFLFLVGAMAHAKQSQMSAEARIRDQNPND